MDENNNAFIPGEMPGNNQMAIDDILKQHQLQQSKIDLVATIKNAAENKQEFTFDSPFPLDDQQMETTETQPTLQTLPTQQQTQPLLPNVDDEFFKSFLDACFMGNGGGVPDTHALMADTFSRNNNYGIPNTLFENAKFINEKLAGSVISYLNSCALLVCCYITPLKQEFDPLNLKDTFFAGENMYYAVDNSSEDMEIRCVFQYPAHTGMFFNSTKSLLDAMAFIENDTAVYFKATTDAFLLNFGIVEPTKSHPTSLNFAELLCHECLVGDLPINKTINVNHIYKEYTKLGPNIEIKNCIIGIVKKPEVPLETPLASKHTSEKFSKMVDVAINRKQEEKKQQIQLKRQQVQKKPNALK